jgi:DNA repair exonuclease SbcCD nuclease subunit
MKILHTADIHLRVKGDERWQALEHLLFVAKENSVDVLVISGDLFDSDELGEELRTEIRTLFTGNAFKIVLIRGNHDENTFRKGYWFGNDVLLLNEEPWSIKEIGDVRFIGLPFQRISYVDTLRLLRQIDTHLDETKANVLLHHGDLKEVVFGFGSGGDETDISGYMPLSLSDLRDTKIDYVLSGHIHPTFDVREYAEGRFFVYPGSPVSVTKKEVGPRMANLLEVGSSPQPRGLITAYYHKINMDLNITDQEDPRQYLTRAISDLPPNAKVVLTIRGFTHEHDEAALVKDFKQICGDKLSGEPEATFRSASEVLRDSLFQKFSHKLSNDNVDPLLRRKLEQVMTQALSKVLAR